MRPIDTNTLNALNGSRTGDQLIAYVWYNGNLAIADPLPIDSWEMDWDTTRQIQQITLSLTDTDGKLSPWLLNDPLGVGGSQLQVMYQVGGAGVVNMGWYRIITSAPNQNWFAYIVDDLGNVTANSPIPPNKTLLYVSGGSQVSITGNDLAINAANSQLIAPDSPQGTSPTVLSEIARLMDGIAPVITDAGVTDTAVSTKLVYEQDRLNNIQTLAHNLTADYRFNGDGQMEIYSILPTTPVWTVQGGPEGVLVSVNPSQSLTGLYNIFVVTGTATVGTTSVPIQAIAQITAGPLAVGGPHGSYPVFYDSTLITNQAQASTYAHTMMTTQLAGLTVELTVTCLPHPGLQQGDWVWVISPMVNAQQVGLQGKVQTMTLKSNGNTVDMMTLTIECNYTDVQYALGGVDRS